MASVDNATPTLTVERMVCSTTRREADSARRGPARPANEHPPLSYSVAGSRTFASDPAEEIIGPQLRSCQSTKRDEDLIAGSMPEFVVARYRASRRAALTYYDYRQATTERCDAWCVRMRGDLRTRSTKILRPGVGVALMFAVCILLAIAVALTF